MLIELDGFYELPDTWNDILLSEFIAINELASKVPEEEATEAEKLEYYIDFIVAFGIPKDEIVTVKIHTEEEGELGIINLFNHLWQFTQMPIDNTFEDFSTFEIGKQKFMFNQDSLDLTGGVKPMASYTYEEYKESNGILTSMAKVGEGKLEHLALLCAIFFRPPEQHWYSYLSKPKIEAYNEDKIKDRAELFTKKLTMEKVFRAYFFC